MKTVKRMLCVAVAICFCGVILTSCDVDEDTSSGIVPAYKSSPTSSSSENYTSEVVSDSDESLSSEEVSDSDESLSATQSTTATESTVPSGVGDDTTENKSGEIIYIEGVGYDILSVVNKKYVLLEEDSESPELTVLPESTTDRGDTEYKADKRAAEPLAAFLEAAREAGHKPIVYSAYRTYAYQKNLYEQAINKWLNSHPGSTREDAAAGVTKTAPTGTSEHCIGLAFDIYSWQAYNEFGKLSQSFEDYELCKWLMENAHKYGFILRYPKDKEDITMIDYEPWHFRYVGIEAATEIYEQGLCLEEYTGKL